MDWTTRNTGAHRNAQKQTIHDRAQYTTQWFNIVTWNGLAEATEKLVQKGNTYFVSGRLVVRQYDAKGGGKGVSVDVIATMVTPVGKKSSDTPSDKHPTVRVTSPSGNGLTEFDPFGEDELSGL